MNKKVSLGVTICLMAIAAAIAFTVTMYFSLNIFNSKISNVNEREALYSKLSEIDTLVRSNGLFEIDEDGLMDSIANGYMTGLDDDYARYMTQEEYRSYQMENAGQLVGIGVTVSMDESGYISVLEVTSGSPAEEAGILPGDLIIKVGDGDVLAVGYTESVSNLRGEEGTSVSITVRRGDEEFSADVTRKLIQTTTVTYDPIGDYGYIHIDGFDATTPEDFERAVSSLMTAEVKGFIFDVRENTGGLVSSVAEVLDYLLPEGDLVSQTNKQGETQVLYTSDANCISMPMVVLVNGNTASAAELFACDLRDFNVASLVGENTFGKGILQTAYALEDGSAINLTTAYYNPHSGVNFHTVGLKPDYEVSLTAEQKMELFRTLSYEDDAQLQKAISVLDAEIQ